jgi:hypothetical protein
MGLERSDILQIRRPFGGDFESFLSFLLHGDSNSVFPLAVRFLYLLAPYSYCLCVIHPSDLVFF